MKPEPLRDLEGAQGRLSLPRRTPTRAPAPLRHRQQRRHRLRHPLRRGGHRDTPGRRRGVTRVARGAGKHPNPPTQNARANALCRPPPPRRAAPPSASPFREAGALRAARCGHQGEEGSAGEGIEG